MLGGGFGFLGAPHPAFAAGLQFAANCRERLRSFGAALVHLVEFGPLVCGQKFFPCHGVGMFDIDMLVKGA